MSNLTISNFSVKHEEISREFLSRVAALIRQPNAEIETYGINKRDYSGETESIKLTVNENSYLTIQLTTKN